MTLPDWWKHAICYQIYPRSFADGSGDGIGDLPGIIDKLDYLQWLGVTVLWISPFFPSPNFDWGYDVADYTDVDADYGTLADVDRLIAEAHNRGIRILLDLVMNHTSDQHPWFQESRSSRDNPKRDWYIWRDGKNGGYPNDWDSLFGGSAWTLDAQTGQYFYHLFFAEQPDLNWRNPEVKQAMFDVMRFWLDKGVDGFRIDAIGSVFEAEDLRNSEIVFDLEKMFADFHMGVFDDWETVEKKLRYQQNLPEMHGLLREVRQLSNTFEDRVLLGETEDASMYGDGSDELHSVFNFRLIGSLDAERIRQQLTGRAAELPSGAWEANTVGNHDRQRSATFYADGQHDDLRARMALALVTFIPGTPVYYYGEEIGMTHLRPATLEDFKDTVGTRFYHIVRKRLNLSHEETFALAADYICRDGCRTPLQWENAPNAGFSPEGVVTWLPAHPNYAQGINVADQRDQPGSMLTFFRELVQTRQNHPALKTGDFELLDETGDVLAFWRRLAGEAYIVLLNMSADQQTCMVEGRAVCVFSNDDRTGVDVDLSRLSLDSYEIFVGRSQSST